MCVCITYVILGTDDPDTIASALVEAKLIDSRNVVVGNTNQQYVHEYTVYFLSLIIMLYLRTHDSTYVAALDILKHKYNVLWG